MDVDNAGRHPFAGTVNNGVAVLDRAAGFNAFHFAVAEIDRRVLELGAFTVIDDDVGHRRRHAGIGLIS